MEMPSRQLPSQGIEGFLFALDNSSALATLLTALTQLTNWLEVMVGNRTKCRLEGLHWISE